MDTPELTDAKIAEIRKALLPPARSKPTAEDLARRFSYHPPKGNQGERYEFLRKHALEFARKVVEATPPSREQDRALEALEECLFLACASIARNE